MSDSARAYWEAQAPAFDDEPDHGLRNRPIRDAWRSLLLEYLPPAPADVMDLGCGTGTLSVLLAESGYRVRGLDLAHAMISSARAKAEEASVPVAFLQGDAAHPPLALASSDVVLCRHLLWAVPNPSAALRKWTNLLRPGGRLLLIEGRWSTGGGVTASDCERLVRQHHSSVTVRHLDDKALWGAAIEDERYLLVSNR